MTAQTQEAAERERLFNAIETVPAVNKKTDWAVERRRQIGRRSDNDDVSNAKRVVPISR